MRFGTVLAATLGLLANGVSAQDAADPEISEPETSDPIDFLSQLNKQALDQLNSTEEVTKRSLAGRFNYGSGCNIFNAGVRKDW